MFCRKRLLKVKKKQSELNDEIYYTNIAQYCIMILFSLKYPINLKSPMFTSLMLKKNLLRV